MTRLLDLLRGDDGPEGIDPVDEVKRGAAASIRWLGIGFLLPLVSVLFVVELRAGAMDVPLALELLVTLVGAALLIATRRSPVAVTGAIGTAWFSAILVTAELHYGLTAGLAAGWMALAMAGHVFYRWRGSLLAVALQLATTLGIALGLGLGWWIEQDFSRFGETEPSVLLRMALVIAGAMVAIATAHDSLLTRLERWHQAANEARVRQQQAQFEHARAVSAMENLQHLESVGRLASGIAHDVNNALTIVMGNAELMGWAEEEEAEDLRLEILAASTAASRATSQLLAIARGAVRGSEEEPVGDLVNSLADLIRRVLPSDIELRVDVRCTRVVRVDAVRFQQVLLHLIANARDAIERRGIVSVVVRDSATTDDGLTVSVSDTGRARDIALTLALEPGEDAGDPGLATVRELAARYGGAVEVESLDPAGTSVTFHVGGLQRPPRDTPRSSEAIAGHVARLWGSQEGMRELAILVAEDEGSPRRKLASYLKDLHASVTFVSDARAAREAIEREYFDLFITDAVMPGGSTLEVIDEFRRRNRRGAVLVVSGHVREDLIRRGIETGTVTFLPKPFTRVQLLEAIARAIRPALPPAVRT